MVSDAIVQAYTSLEIPVPSQDVDETNAYQLQQVRTTGGKEWRGREVRHDVVWVQMTKINLHAKSQKCNIRSYNSRIIGLLNTVFILRRKSQEIYKLAHITRLNWTGNRKPGGPEEMSYLGKFTSGEGQNVVWVQAI